MALGWNSPAKNAIQLSKMGLNQVLQYDRRHSLYKIAWQLDQAKLPFDKVKCVCARNKKHSQKQLATPN